MRKGDTDDHNAENMRKKPNNELDQSFLSFARAYSLKSFKLFWPKNDI